MSEHSGALKDSMIKVYLGYRNIDEILKLLKKKIINRTPVCRHRGLECRRPRYSAPCFISVRHALCVRAAKYSVIANRCRPRFPGPVFIALSVSLYLFINCGSAGCINTSRVACLLNSTIKLLICPDLVQEAFVLPCRHRYCSRLG